MARALTAQDAYAIINLVAKEATGQNPSITAIDPSTFVSVGETILNTGTENTLNALSLVLGRTYAAVRKYNAKFAIVNTLNSGLFTNRIRKISFYARDDQASGAFNTNLYTNHAMGFDNGANPSGGTPQSVGTMWEQNQPVPLELNFAGRSVWDYSLTIYEVQLQQAFRDENSFITFMEGVMTEADNDMETQKEAFNRMTLLNYMAGLYDMNSVMGSAIDMVAAFNTHYGTTYTGTQLRGTYKKEFLEFFVYYVKWLSDTLENRSKKFHWSPTKTINGVSYTLLRHTPKAKQKLVLYKPFLMEAETTVMPEIFNDQYLRLSNYEGVNFWQNENKPSAISVTPAIPDTSDPTEQTAGTAVALDYVLGVMFDEDAVMVDYQLDSVGTSPLEIRKMYRNTVWHVARNSINDFTENGILLYMAS